MDDIDIYLNSSTMLLKKTPSKIVSWVTMLFLFLIFLVCFMSFYKYKKYLKYDAYIKNGYIEFYVDKVFFNKINNNKVLIKEKNYDYDVVSIFEFSYENGANDLWKIIIKVDLEENMMIENNYFQIKFLESEGTTIKRIVKKIKKGLKL